MSTYRAVSWPLDDLITKTTLNEPSIFLQISIVKAQNEEHDYTPKLVWKDEDVLAMAPKQNGNAFCKLNTQSQNFSNITDPTAEVHCTKQLNARIRRSLAY